MTHPVFTVGLGIVWAIASFSVANTGRAQDQGDLYELLRSQRNVAELDLSDTQKKKIEEFRKELSYRKERARYAVKLFEQDTKDQIMDVLTRRQLERLSQLYYQKQGPRALQDPTTAKVLGLSEEQIKQIEKIRQEAKDRYRKDGRNYWNILRERDARYLTVLTRQQRDRWEKMLGPPRKKQLSLTSAQQRELWGYLRKVSPLTNSKYAAELEITDRQRKKIEELARELWSSNPDMQKLRQRYADQYERAVSDRRRIQIQQEMADAMKKLIERGIEKIQALLTHQQRDRLSRLQVRLSQERYRSRGASAIPSEDIAEKLSLTNEQKAKMQALKDAAQKAQLKEQEESRRRLQQIRAERDRKYLDLLSPSQRATWEKMIGQKIKPDV